MKNKKIPVAAACLFFTLLTACAAHSQTELEAGKIQPAATANQSANPVADQKSAPAKTEDAPEKGWKIEMIEAFGVRRLSVPANFVLKKKKAKEGVKSFVDENQTYTSFMLIAGRNAGKLKLFQVEVVISKYDQEEAWLNYRNEKETTEQKIAKNVENNPPVQGLNNEAFIKADFYKVDVVNGSINLRKAPNRNFRTLTWTTFQNVENKLQQMTVYVFHPARETEKAMKILDSLRFVR